ncbi:hypothetical protein H2248_010309 [Termitomyces sp. 'cryptogamus']|nr:hypothetical protein H2248_010309 [Termitomyces sp. 'cryptogamus']
MSQNLALFLLPAEEKFDRSNWVTFKMTITEAVRSRGLLGYLTGKIKNAVRGKGDYDTNGMWMQHNIYARSMVTLNVLNLVGAGVQMDGSTADAWHSLVGLHNARPDLGLLHAEEELGTIRYSDGTSIEAHFKAMQTAWAKANNQGAGINDRQF